jgi:hypothetical protein
MLTLAERNQVVYAVRIPDSAKELILRGNLRGLLATVLDAKGR